MTERKPIAPCMQVCGVDGCGIPLSTAHPCPLHKTTFRFEAGRDA